MSRRVVYTWRSQPLATDELSLDDGLDDSSPVDDASELAMSTHESLTAQQYVVYSATFQVPAFYFTVHDSSLWLCRRFLVCF